MATAFHEIQFPDDISYGSIGGPEFSTEVTELGSGHERRNQNWTYPRERWNVAYGIKAKADLQALRDFFYARKGQLIGFRFKNHDDYSATNQELGDGDGSTTAFQLVRIYTDAGGSLTRKISKPVSGTVVVYVDSVEQTLGADYTLDTTTGIVTFDSAPSSGEVVTADYEFDVPMRFASDYLPLNFETYEARSATVETVELKL